MLDQEVKEDYVEASKEAVLNYIMLDQVPFLVHPVCMNVTSQEERERLNILVGPKIWGPLVVRAPVPWHQSFLQVGTRISDMYIVHCKMYIVVHCKMYIVHKSSRKVKGFNWIFVQCSVKCQSFLSVSVPDICCTGKFWNIWIGWTTLFTLA